MQIKPENIEANWAVEELTLDFELSVIGNPVKPWILIGGPNSSRIELGGMKAGVKLDGSVANPEFTIFAGNDPGTSLSVIFQPNEGDNFIKKMLGVEPLKIDLNGMVLWSSKSGLGFNGQAGFKYEYNLRKSLSAFEFQTIRLQIWGDEKGLKSSVGAGISVNIGPFKAHIENIGVQLNLNDKDISNNPGNLGSADLVWDFNPPNGIALQIDAKGVKGGGYLFFDHQQEKYAGALELKIGTGKKKFQLKAVGILTTKLPNNEDGYSLLVIITGEFNPIPIGLGFSLNGVGGVIGLHRTMNLPAFRAGVRNNSLSSVLFPKDPINEIQKIITDLEQFFPAKEKRHSFGIMAKIAYQKGGEELMILDVGVLLEIPKPIRIALIGILQAHFPSDTKTIRLQVNFVGTWEPERKYITFDASLYNSKLGNFPLIGDMALRILYGEEPNFLVSVGGFHPAYEVPPLDLPVMRRLNLSLTKDNDPRLILSAYLAVTSNTVQVGALIDFYFELLGKYAITGFLGFDALFQFSPFYFNVNFAAMLAVKNMNKNKSILAIALGLNLEGPTPWRARGYGSFTLAGMTFEAKIDKTFGKEENTVLPDIELLPRVKAELENLQNWESILPAERQMQVTLAKMDGELVAHPYGILSVGQKIVPLGLQLEKYGHQQPADHRKFDFELKIGGNTPDTDRVQEYFAPADFQEMSDAEKIRRKSFEKFDAGLQLKGHQEVKMNFFRQRACEYETVVMTNRYQPEDAGKQLEEVGRFERFQGGSASYISIQSAKKTNVQSGPRVKIKTSGYKIVYKRDLQIYEEAYDGNQAGAMAFLMQELDKNPALEGLLQVIPARLVS